MATLVAGIKHQRDGIEPQGVIGSDMSTVGIVGTAPGADIAAFPLNTAVVVNTNDTALRASLGATGTIVDALIGVSAQVGGDVGAARTVVVRVTDDVDPHVVIANIIGIEANETGIWEFLNAPEDLGVTPRLLIAPGYTSQSKEGLADPVITAPGTGGADGTFALAFTGGTGSGAVGTFTVTSGAVTAVAITERGVYTDAPSLDTAASAGLTGATFTTALEQVANAICAIMPTVAARLQATFIPEGPTGTRQDAIDWMETLPREQRILHPLRQDAKVTDSDGNVVAKPFSPYIAGLYVRRDAEQDGIPGHSIANQQIRGIVGLSPNIPFSITDASSLGQDDLLRSFGIAFRGDYGVSGSLTDGGYTFWGTDTLDPASEWLFASVARMRDYLELLQVKAVKFYLGKYNITSQTIQAIINTMEGQLSGLRADQHILDYRIGFDPDQNSPEDLRLGYLDLSFQAEEPPVLRKVTIHSRRHREALETLVRNIAIQLGTEVNSA